MTGVGFPEQHLITTAVAAANRTQHEVAVTILEEIQMLLGPIHNRDQILPLEGRVHDANGAARLAMTTLVDADDSIAGLGQFTHGRTERQRRLTARLVGLTRPGIAMALQNQRVLLAAIQRVWLEDLEDNAFAIHA